jgi:hypothetical protein
LGIVNIAAKRTLNRPQVGSEAVACELNAISETRC